jgi:hypothetical protein
MPPQYPLRRRSTQGWAAANAFISGVRLIALKGDSYRINRGRVHFKASESFRK